ncbi:MAG: MCE family protein [Phycisphaerales bacterium]|nr:MCE family protein [Phycisphaerales bacterium]
MSVAVIKKNNVMAGSFLLASIILALVIAFVLGDFLGSFGDKAEYSVRFPTSVGVVGLKSGAEVTFAGLPVGQVVAVEPELVKDPNSGVMIPSAMLVRISIDSDIRLHEDAFADLSPPILGGVSRINFTSAGAGSYEGGPSDADGLLQPGEILRGRFAPSILAQLGFTSEQADQIKDTIARAQSISANADEITASIRRMANTLEPEFGSGVSDGRMTIANIRAFTDKLNSEGGWASRVDGVLSKADGVMDDVSVISSDAKATTNSVREMIDTNRGRIDSIIANVDETTANIRGKIDPTTERLNELLEKGTLALGSYNEVAGNANALLLDARPKIDATLDNVRMASTQGNLFLEEVRSQPWRLLAKPKKEDLEREPLYEAARTYASAVGDLRAASEALDAAVSGQVTGVSASDIARIAQVVDAAYGRYENAERGLLEVLKLPTDASGKP